MSAAARYLLYAQLVFWGFVLLCLAIDEGGVSNNHGFSFYGGRPATIVPYALGFLVASVLIARGASLIEREATIVGRRMATGLRVLVVLLLADLFTPDTISRFFYGAHVLASTALFLSEAIFGLWIVVVATRAGGPLALYVTQVAGGVVAGLSELQLLGLLSAGILVFQVAFGWLLVAATAESQVLEPA